MKALLICIGSRGDAEPFIALTARMLQKDNTNNSVELFIQPELKSLLDDRAFTINNTQKDNLTIHELPFTQFDFYKYTTTATKGSNHENERVRFVGVVSEVIAGLVLPCWEMVHTVAKNCDVMVTSALARYLCFALSTKLDIPTVLINLQPLTPTKCFLHYSCGEECVMAIMKVDSEEKEETTAINNDMCTDKSDDYAETYWIFEKYGLEFLREELIQMYDAMGLQPYMDYISIQSITSGNDARVIIANAMNDGLIPPVKDGGRNIHQVGPLADHYIPTNYEPPEDLVTFLSNNPPPICIGFGSMPYDNAPLIYSVLEAIDCKAAILIGKALEMPKDNTELMAKNIIHVTSIPYAWLLPQCQLMICHGGAGVVAATIRAGIPLVISPFFGDQFFHAELCKAKGLGTRAGLSLPKATKDDFVEAIEGAALCADAAKKFGEKSREKSLGVDSIMTLLCATISQRKFCTDD